MPALHFHPLHSWNLIEDLRYSGIIPETRLRGYPEHRLNQGRQAGWINRESRQAARQMFVFAETVLLPGEIDVPLMELNLFEEHHLDWATSRLPEGEGFLLKGKSEDLVSAELPSTLAALTHHPGIDPDAVRDVIDWWGRLRAYEVRSKQYFGCEDEWRLYNADLRGHIASNSKDDSLLWPKLSPLQRKSILAIAEDDPLRERQKFAYLDSIVEEIYGFYRFADRLARRGFPTFSTPSPRRRALATSHAHDVDVLVRFYFDRVRVPGPETAKEAIRYRQLDRVIEWREKIKSWQLSLAKEHIDLRAIRDEIDDASAYIEGSRVIRTQLGGLSPWLILSLGTIEAFMPEMQAKTYLELGLLGVEVLRRVGTSVEESVTGQNPLKHNWVLVEPVQISD